MTEILRTVDQPGSITINSAATCTQPENTSNSLLTRTGLAGHCGLLRVPYCVTSTRRTGAQGGRKVTLGRLCQGFLTWNKRLEVSVISVSWRSLAVNQIERAQKTGQQQNVLKV